MPKLPALSTSDRKLACLHEAGHAFVHALTGNKVISLIVADAGRFGSIVQGRRCRVLKGNAGVCAYEPKNPALGFSDEEMEMLDWWMVADTLDEIRAEICATLAGYAAEVVLDGEEAKFSEEYGSDFWRVAALCKLLPDPLEEYKRLLDTTENLMMHIKNGRRIKKLAKILEKDGRIDFKNNRVAAQLLPEPRYGWM